MSIQYCDYCDKSIDLDFDVEHFQRQGSAGRCLSSANNKMWGWGHMVVRDVPLILNEEGEKRSEGCRMCNLKLAPEEPTVTCLDSDGQGMEYFCSWDCASELNDLNNNRCDDANKRLKQEPPEYQTNEITNRTTVTYRH